MFCLSRFSTLCFALVLTAHVIRFAAGEARATETVGVEVDPAKTVCQKVVAVDNACTPAVVVNALRFGPPRFRDVLDHLPCKTDAERVQYLIDHFASKPSIVDPKRAIFTPDYGVDSEDFPPFFNSILATGKVSPLSGTYFDRPDNEQPGDHLRRVHTLFARSLGKHVPVITSIRSFGAVARGAEFFWEGLAAHTILIIRVPKELEVDAQGFVFEFIEPSTGGVREGYVYSEKVRGFKAPKRTVGNDAKWIDRGFLLVVAPSLILQTDQQPWQARTFMTLNYGLGDFVEK